METINFSRTTPSQSLDFVKIRQQLASSPTLPPRNSGPVKQGRLAGAGSRSANYKHLIKSKKFADCDYRFTDPLGETPAKQVFKFQLCGANGIRKANYVGYQFSYEHLMPCHALDTTGMETQNHSNWKAVKRELAALDILACDNVIQPEEFVKTKHHCYIVKEYANGGSIAQLLHYRGQDSSQQRSGRHSPPGNFLSNKRLSELETQRVMADLISALLVIYEAGLAVWDLSLETLLLSIGCEISCLSPAMHEESKEGGHQLSSVIEQQSGCFKQLDSLRRHHFEVKLKDLAIAKRAYCKSKLVCVPDSTLKRNCNADVYAIGMLILQLVLGFDLFKATEADLKRIEVHEREFTAEFMSCLQLIFSGSCTFEQLVAHPFLIEVTPLGQPMTTPVVKVQITYDAEMTGAMVADTCINLACFDTFAQLPYQQEIKKLLEKDAVGKSGIRVLDDSLAAYIERGQSPFKSISLPKPDQILTRQQNEPIQSEAMGLITTSQEYDSPQDISGEANEANTKQSPAATGSSSNAQKRPQSIRMRGENYNGQLLQSSKKKVPRYSSKIDPTAKKSIAAKRARNMDDEEDDGCCNNKPCQRGQCAIF